MQKSDGTTLPTTRYTPFGNLRSGTGFAPFTNRDFTGQRENRELGLLYYQARYYLPGIGRCRCCPAPPQPDRDGVTMRMVGFPPQGRPVGKRGVRPTPDLRDGIG